MTESFKKLMCQQAQESLSPFSGLVGLPIPMKGWIQTIRKALGISTYALAKRLGSSQANVGYLEKRERKGTISLAVLEKVANALNCKLAYCLVPLNSLDRMLENQPREIAKKRIRPISHSMQLEQQGLTAAQLKREEDNLVQELLAGNPNKLWGNND